VAIKSATEPFDTSSPIGSFLFQLLASLAELEKSTIAERTSLGRNRVASDGQYTGGSVPFGYALDESNRLVPSQRRVPGLEITESDLVRDVFARIASGEATMNSECARLTALGVPRGRRYGGKDARVVERVAGWSTSSLGTILHNPTYKGEGRINSRYGPVQCATPALVNAESWDRAQEALLRKRNLAMKNAKHVYLLRGLIRCQSCGHAYTGSSGKDGRRYRCGESCGRASGGLQGRCTAKTLRADWLEDAVWQECRRFILNPGEALDEARAKLREQMTKASGFESRRREALEKLTAKETERERALTLFRRGLTSLDETEAQLEAISREAGVLREMLESQRAQAALIDAHETFLTESTTLLVRLRDELADIEATNDLTRKRQVIEQYVRQIMVETREIAPRKKHADVRIFLRLEPSPIAVENATSSRSGSR
jgi:site-specific DNA recombinase